MELDGVKFVGVEFGRGELDDLELNDAELDDAPIAGGEFDCGVMPRSTG